MGLTSSSADLVALNTVGGGSLIMAGRAGHDVTPCGLAVERGGPRVRSEPADGVRIGASDSIGANTSLHVAAVACLDFVATQATCGIRIRLDRVACDIVRTVHEVALDRIGAPHFDGQGLAGIVAPGTVRLRVTLAADLGMLGS